MARFCFLRSHNLPCLSAKNCDIFWLLTERGCWGNTWCHRKWCHLYNNYISTHLIALYFSHPPVSLLPHSWPYLRLNVIKLIPWQRTRSLDMLSRLLFNVRWDADVRKMSQWHHFLWHWVLHLFTQSSQWQSQLNCWCTGSLS